MGWSHSPETGSVLISQNLLRSQPQTIYILVLCVKVHQLVCRSWAPGQYVVLTPLEQEVPNILKTVEIPAPKPYMYLFLVSRGINCKYVMGPKWYCSPFEQDVPRYFEYSLDPHPNTI